MAVVIETTLGDITVDLYLKERPRACLNFLKLCKMKYYNYNLFHTVSRGFIAQTGDPTGSRNGGESIFGMLEGSLKRYFAAETNPQIKHTIMGLVSFVGNEENMIGSQFFLTLGEELTYLDGKHCVFGRVTEGLDVLEVINEAICDVDERPYQDIRITHTVILDDPLPDLPRMVIPSRSPSPSAERLQGGRIAPDEEIDETAEKSLEEINEMIAQREAKARATILEMVGDLPDAEMAPPENVLFVCKLNPVTTDDDLEIIFSRFGKIKSCEVIRDHKTGDSLQYAFVEFEEQKSCEDAYFKMDNVLIDDRRIHVDFSQSVSKVKWMGKGRGVRHFDDNKSSKSNGRHPNPSYTQQKTRRDRSLSKSPKRKQNSSKKISPHKDTNRSSRRWSPQERGSREKSGRSVRRKDSRSPCRSHEKNSHERRRRSKSRSPRREDLRSNSDKIIRKRRSSSSSSNEESKGRKDQKRYASKYSSVRRDSSSDSCDRNKTRGNSIKTKKRISPESPERKSRSDERKRKKDPKKKKRRKRSSSRSVSSERVRHVKKKSSKHRS